jgi:Ca-activated chloride channel family protein
MRISLLTTRLPPATSRRGAMLVLIAIGLLVLVAMAAFTVDVTYMQLTRTELRTASDAAARSGVENLRRTRDADEARQAAIATAARNEVAGRPFQLTTDDIDIGCVERQSDGTWDFTPDKEPFTGLRINAAMTDSSVNGAIGLFFGDALGRGTFQPRQTSVAAYTDVEICLVIDRSHSMCFDLSGVDWKYPPGLPRLVDPMTLPPHDTLSRWAALTDAVDSFVATLNQHDPKPRVALVTWASQIDRGDYRSPLNRITSPVTSLDQVLTISYSLIQTSLSLRGTLPMLGATNMAAGIDHGVIVLKGATVKPYATKVLILMTDGLWNQGRDPKLAAADARAAGIIVHTIGFLSQAQSADLQTIADTTGGRCYFAANKAELEAAFEELANLLPVVLTE